MPSDAASDASIAPPQSESSAVSHRQPKKKVVLFMAYNGDGYHGMQINGALKTIESELFAALVAANAVSRENSTDITKNAFMRACRTDKGVHAAAQLVSLKMIVEGGDVVQRIASHLPSSIRVFGVQEVARSFHAKNFCDSRIYEYLLPTFVLDPFSKAFVREKLCTFAAEKTNSAKRPKRDADEEEAAADAASATAPSGEYPAPSDEQRSSFQDFRISAAKLQLLRETLQAFVGTRNFHNFTVGKGFGDASAKRYIKSFTASDPFVAAGLEWVSLRVHGASFMLHQIRKMVGLVILTLKLHDVKSSCDSSFGIEDAFSAVKINIPKAPATGLLLERCFFDVYNKNVRFAHRDAVSFDAYAAEIEAFKQNFIYPHIFESEHRHFHFWHWLGCIEAHAYEFGYLVNRAEENEDSDDRRQSAASAASSDASKMAAV